MTTQKFTDCMVCGMPWVNQTKPFICPVCQLTGKAARELAETRAHVLSLKGRNEALKRRLEVAGPDWNIKGNHDKEELE